MYYNIFQQLFKFIPDIVSTMSKRFPAIVEAYIKFIRSYRLLFTVCTRLQRNHCLRRLRMALVLNMRSLTSVVEAILHTPPYLFILIRKTPDRSDEAIICGWLPMCVLVTLQPESEGGSALLYLIIHHL